MSTSQFFELPETVQRLHEGPLGAHIDAYASRLLEQGFSSERARDRIRLITDFSRWLQRGKLGAADVTAQVIEFCRECGFSYRDLERDEQAFLAVAEANCRYLAPARYDDEITVETQLSRVKSRIVEFTYRILTGTKVPAEGRTVHVIIRSDGKPRTLPERYMNLLKEKVATPQ
jgi:acyl-CoA thioester hydrolase